MLRCLRCLQLRLLRGGERVVECTALRFACRRLAAAGELSATHLSTTDEATTQNGRAQRIYEV
jgi:hypothetical protein